MNNIKIIFFSLLIFNSYNCFAQKKNYIEKTKFGVQTGILGIWLNNETRINNKITFRSEFGLDAGLFSNNSNQGTGFILAPVFTAEPRWYYNIAKRSSNNKNIKNNSANFVTIEIIYHPDWFVISNSKNINISNQVSIIPKWGIKRTFNNHFVYEAGIGIGHQFFLENSVNKKGETAVDIHLRIGYTF